MDNIGLSSAAKETVLKYYVNSAEYEFEKQSYYNNEQECLFNLNNYPDNLQRTLSLFTRLAYDLREQFIEQNIPEKIYLDTFEDLRIWNEICFLENGVCGLKETSWLTAHLHLGIFKLGRLQFQPDKAHDDIQLSGVTIKKGTKIYNIHIPKGENLTPYLCGQSLCIARKFFDDSKAIFHCDSWLLSPRLNALLPSESNIIKFKNLFEIYSTDYTCNSVERYLFGKVIPDKSLYLPTSNFAAKVKQAAINGQVIGSACGVIK